LVFVKKRQNIAGSFGERATKPKDGLKPCAREDCMISSQDQA